MLKLNHTFSFVALSAAFLLTTGLLGTAQAQSDNAPSVAEAARRAREQKKSAAKPGRTLTNDNLPAAPPAGSPEAGAQTSAKSSDGTASAGATDASATIAGAPS